MLLVVVACAGGGRGFGGGVVRGSDGLGDGGEGGVGLGNGG